MPSPLTSNPSSSVAKTSSANAINNIGAAAPILQGLMEGQGWRDQRGEILERDQQSALAIARLRQAAMGYDAAPTDVNRDLLIAAVKEELNIARTEYNYAKSQQQYYAKEAAREAKAQAGRQQGWGEWLMGGVKSFFGSTTEQQVEKYAEIAQKRQALADQLQQALTQLTAGEKEAKSVQPEEEPVEIVSKLTKKTRAASKQQQDDLATMSDTNVMPQLHSRRLLQSSATSPHEFRVNTYTIGGQSSPKVATLTNGNFVITWESDNDGSNYGVYAQLYARNGTVLRAEFLVNTNITNHQFGPSIGALTNGGFVIAWESLYQDGDLFGVYAQRYSANAIPQGTEFRVNTYTTERQSTSRIAGLTTGDFIITWMSYGQDGDDYGVYAQRYSTSGVPQGTEFQVNTNTTNFQGNPTISALTSGDFVIAWASVGQDGDDSGVYAQRYAANGTRQGVEFRVNTNTTSSGLQSIAGLTNGNFVVTWASSGQDGDSYGIYAQRYAANGTPQGSEFRVNTYTTNSQNAPNIGALKTGDFVIAWSSNGQDGDSNGIYAQRYTANGVPQGYEFRVNTNTTDGQIKANIAALSNGDFVITWQSNLQDGDSWGCYAGLFSPPIFGNNRLTINEDSSVIFTANELSAGDTDSSNSTLLFTISDLQHGVFQRVSNSSSLTQFTQQDVTSGEVRFVHDGSELAPVYNVSISDGQLTVGPLATAINFVNINDPPTFINNRLNITEGGSIIFTRNELNVSDPDSADSNLQFTILNLSHGVFSRVSTNVTFLQFTQALIDAGQVRLEHDGSETPPIYTVRVKDEVVTVGPVAPFPVTLIPVNDPPVLVNNRLTLKKGETVALRSSELSASDVDSDNTLLQFSIAGLQHGVFQRINDSTPTIVFSQQEISDGLIRFIHQDDELPTYQVTVSDGELTAGPSPAMVSFNAQVAATLPIALIAGAGGGGIAALCLLYALYRYKTQQSKATAVKTKMAAQQSSGTQSPQPSSVELSSLDKSAQKTKLDLNNVVVAIAPTKAAVKVESDPTTSADSLSQAASQSVSDPISSAGAGSNNSAASSSSSLPDSKHGVKDSANPTLQITVPDADPRSRPTSPSSPTPLSPTGKLELSFDISYNELEFKETDKLGSGAYGIVYKGNYQSHEVAIKKLNASKFNKAALAELRQEAGIMASMNSGYIVRLEGVCLQPPNFCMVMELMPKGSLYDVLRNGQPLTQAVICNIGMDVAYGLSDLHQKNVLHRDLKSLNVLLDSRMRAKVSDFGLSKIKSEIDSMSAVESMKGTGGWMAPELFEDRAEATKASDMYSYGMVLWEMLHKPYRIPFKDVNKKALGTVKEKRGYKQEELPADCPEPMKELVTSCWQPEAKQRPSAQAVAKSLGQLFSALSNESAPRSVAKVEVLEQTPEAQSEIPGYLSNTHSGQPVAGAASRPAVPEVVEVVEPEAQSEVPGYLSNTRSS